MNKHVLYLLVESEPYLSGCVAWKERHDAGMKASWAFARSLGADCFLPGMNNELVALPVLDPVPEGWKVLKARRVNEKSRLIPIVGKAGDAVRAALAALPKMPRWHEIAELIGHPCQINYSSEAGGIEGAMCTAGVGFWRLVDLAWTREHFLILAPDTAPMIQELRDEIPDIVIEQGEWPVPPGLRPISKARWDLIFAQAKVEEEERKEARTS